MVYQCAGGIDPSAPEAARQASGTEAPKRSPLESVASPAFPSVSYNSDRSCPSPAAGLSGTPGGLGGLGFEPGPGERLCADSAGSLSLFTAVFSVAVSVTCCHLLFLPLNSAPVNFVILSTLSLLGFRPCLDFCLHLPSMSLDPVFSSLSYSHS